MKNLIILAVGFSMFFAIQVYAMEGNNEFQRGSSMSYNYPGTKSDVIIGQDSNRNSKNNNEIAIISGVPRYYQKYITCDDADEFKTFFGEIFNRVCECPNGFPTGCGPVAGATILGWYDRRGYELIDDDEVDANGLPMDTIILLGEQRYMDLDPNNGCNASGVSPDDLIDALEKYFDKKGYDFDIQAYTLMGNKYYKGIAHSERQLNHLSSGTIEDLFNNVVKPEIDSGHPLIMGLNAFGEQGNYGDFKPADHAVTVVGYDNSQGDYRLIIQYNWEDNNELTPYREIYWNKSTPIRLTDYSTFNYDEKNNPYLLISITPKTEVDYEGNCDHLNVEGVDNSDFQAKDGLYDQCHLLNGVYYPYFRPDGNLTVPLGPTDFITLQDNECFVASWPSDSYKVSQSLYDRDLDRYSDLCDLAELSVEITSVSYEWTEDNYVKMDIEATVENISPREDASNVLVQFLLTGAYSSAEHYLVDQGTTSLASGFSIDLNSSTYGTHVDLSKSSDSSHKATISRSWYLDLNKHFYGGLGQDECVAFSVDVVADPKDEVEEENENGCLGGCDGSSSEGNNMAKYFVSFTDDDADCSSSALFNEEFDSSWVEIINNSILFESMKNQTIESGLIEIIGKSQKYLNNAYNNSVVRNPAH